MLLRGSDDRTRIEVEQIGNEGVRVLRLDAVRVQLVRREILQVLGHDLRRTFGKLAHKWNAALEQIQLSLGHASLVTAERYLGVRQNLHDPPCDYLGLDVKSN